MIMNFVKKLTKSCSILGILAIALISMVSCSQDVSVPPAPQAPKELPPVQNLKAELKSNGLDDKLTMVDISWEVDSKETYTNFTVELLKESGDVAEKQELRETKTVFFLTQLDYGTTYTVKVLGYNNEIVSKETTTTFTTPSLKTVNIKWELNGHGKIDETKDYSKSYTQRDIDNFKSVVVPTIINDNTDYELVNWYKEPTFENIVYNFPEIGEAETVTFYAKWRTVGERTITYKGYDDFPGADNYNPTKFKIVEGVSNIHALTDLPIGYVFVGWHKDSVDGEIVESIPKNTNTNVTLYAEIKLLNYQITYNIGNNGTNSPDNKTSVTIKDKFELKPATRGKDKFLYWKNNKNEKVTTIDGLTSNLELTAVFDVYHTVTYTYKTDEGNEMTIKPTNDHLLLKGFYESDKKVNFVVPEFVDCEYVRMEDSENTLSEIYHWDLSVKDKTRDYIINCKCRMVLRTVTLYVSFGSTPNAEYYATSNQGSLFTFEPYMYEQIKFATGEVKPLPEATSIEGSKFIGWVLNMSDTKTIKDTSELQGSNKNIRLLAKFEHKPSTNMVAIPAGKVSNVPGKTGDQNVGDYSIGKYEVTQLEYCRLTGVAPVAKIKKQVTVGPGVDLSKVYSKEEIEELSKLPINFMSYTNIAGYCNDLSKAEGLEPCFTFVSEQQIDCDTTKNGYRIPTLAEWVYAAQGGNVSAEEITTYSGSNNLAEVGNVGTNYVKPVGSLKPNKLGIFDMSGNVNERIIDMIQGQHQFVGGSFNEKPGYAQIRSQNTQATCCISSKENMGFRIVRNGQ